MIEHRYEERGDAFQLRSFPDEGREQMCSGPSNCRPEWLLRILEVATIGGHMANVQHPPPSKILWFITDDALNFNSFQEIQNV